MSKFRSHAVIAKANFCRGREGNLFLEEKKQNQTPSSFFVFGESSNSLDFTLLACLTVQLDSRSKYALVPCTFAPGNESTFTVTIFSEHDLKLRQLKDAREVSLEVTLRMKSTLEYYEFIFSNMTQIGCIKFSLSGRKLRQEDVLISPLGETIPNSFWSSKRKPRSWSHWNKKAL